MFWEALAVGTGVFGINMYLTKYLLTEPLGQGHTLLVNCLSGAVDILDQKTYQALVKDRFNNLNNSLLQALIDRGYLFRNEIDEQKSLKRLENKYSKGKQVIDFVFCPTFDCNLACRYCFQKNLNKSNLYLTKESIPSIAKALTKMFLMLKGKVAIQLFGGEPLLPKNKPFIKEILAFANLKKIPVAITTNGTTINYFKDLLTQYRNIIKMAQITIDGPPEVHNKRRVPRNKKPTFNIIMRGIKLLLKLNIAVHARVNVDKSNVNYLPKLASILKQQGLFNNPNFKCSLAPVANHCKADKSKSLLDENELLKTISDLRSAFPKMKYLNSDRIPKTVKHLHAVLHSGYSSPRFTYCQASRRGYFIFAPDGFIYPCSEAAGHPELAIGRFIPDFCIFEKEYERWGNRSILNISKCLKCPIAPLCGGGCAYASYAINGNIYEAYCHDALKVLKSYLKANKHQFRAQLDKAKIA